MSFYTYFHCRADDGRVFYVGKGSEHERRAYSRKGRSPFWHRTAAKHGLVVHVAARFEDEKEAFEHERFLIQCFRDLQEPLANLTDGGEGPTGLRHGPETRKRLSEVQKGRKRTPEQVAATSAGNRGQKRTLEQRTRMAQAQIGRECKPETKEKLRAINRGKTMDPETRAKISAALKGRPRSAEHAAACVEGRKKVGYNTGPEAALKAWATKRARAAARASEAQGA